jgi:hypothetical protein
MASITLRGHLATAVSAIAIVAISRSAGAQTAANRGQAPRHPRVCAGGVRTYPSVTQVPTPFDSLAMPPAPGPVRVTNPAEAEAADRAVRERAGSVGATGVVVSDVTEDTGGGMRIRRSVLPVFVPSDSARAQQACRK